MKQNLIQEKSFQFSVDLVKLVYWLDKFCGNHTLKQLLRSWTSIWANIEEALWWQSRQDFIHKLSIAHKESREVVYWIKVIMESKIFASTDRNLLLQEATEIWNILSKIIITTKNKDKQ